ncbi:DUF6894 family protein [Sphingomonas aerophila]|uniref:DUF6894 domain-containing protein n=1 Tax=Sphingomonas aerophila TaxID=1344948 RepID=A0A7W9EW44_9SPHN|nr:hypothetical protein [Sphingomonas aerophila]MBB5717019.1 hypothetical protein [Sphingomonas aerophila]
MQRFFFHLRDHVHSIIDPDGVELPDLSAARQKTLGAARDVLSADIKTGLLDLRFRIDVEDEDGQIVHSLPFAQAFAVIQDDNDGRSVAAFRR